MGQFFFLLTRGFFVETFLLFYFSPSVANRWKVVGPSSHPKPLSTLGHWVGYWPSSRREKKRNNAFSISTKKEKAGEQTHRDNTQLRVSVSLFVLGGLPSHRHWTQLICFPTFFFFLFFNVGRQQPFAQNTWEENKPTSYFSFRGYIPNHQNTHTLHTPWLNIF